MGKWILIYTVRQKKVSFPSKSIVWKARATLTIRYEHLEERTILYQCHTKTLIKLSTPHHSRQSEI